MIRTAPLNARLPGGIVEHREGVAWFVRHPMFRSVASVMIYIGALEVISSFVAKQMFDYDLTFTPYFFALGLLGLILLVIERFV